MTSDTITSLPLAALHESPFNPRKRFDQAALQELADDIRAQGRILQPLLVRPIVPPLWRNEDGSATDPDAQAGFEIVFGHRRFRAAAIAGLVDVPCMLRSMTDDEARRAQISENLSRKDVHPIEEAEGFQALIDNGSHTADEIAAEWGKSRSYVYGRLKLLQACPEIRNACLDGEIGSEVALLVARLRTPKLQARALGYIKAEWRAKLDDGGKASYRAIRDLLNEKFTLELKAAIFDTTDPTLVPPAGDCPSCPKRSGNAPEFVDVATPSEARNRHGKQADRMQHQGPDVCTDPDCFETKKKAHLARLAAKLYQEGFEVVNGPAARAALSADGSTIKGAYVSTKVLGRKSLSEVRGAALRGGGTAPGLYKIIDQRTGKVVDALRRHELKGAGVVVEEEPSKQSSNHGGLNYNSAEGKRQLAEQAAKWKVERVVRIKLLEQVRAAIASSERSLFDLQLVANRLLSRVNWRDQAALAAVWNVPQGNDEEAHGLVKAAGSMSASDLGRLLLDCAIFENVGGDEDQPYLINHTPEALMRAAAHYGIDVEKIRAEIASTPSTAAHATDNAEAAPGDEASETADQGQDEEIEQKDEAGFAVDGVELAAEAK